MLVSSWDEMWVGVVVADLGVLDRAYFSGFFVFAIMQDFVAGFPFAVG